MRYKWACLRTGGCGQKFARASAHTFFSPPLTQPPQFQNRVYAHEVTVTLVPSRTGVSGLLVTETDELGTIYVHGGKKESIHYSVFVSNDYFKFINLL